MADASDVLGPAFDLDRDDRLRLVAHLDDGPALGEYVADLLEGRTPPDPRFGLGPLAATGSLRTAGPSG